MPLEIYRRGRIWHYRGTIGPAGKRRMFRGSCRTASKDIAARQVAEIEDRYWKGHFDGPAAILTFAQAVAAYRNARKPTRFLDEIEEYFGRTLVKDITAGAIREMAIALYPDVSGATLNRSAIAPAMAVINYAAKSGLCSPIKVERYKVDEKVRNYATLEWVDKFRVVAPPHIGALALFMFLTGARVSEALAVTWDDVDLTERTVLIKESKQSKERLSHLPLPLVVVLANLEHIPERGVFGYETLNGLKGTWHKTIAVAGIKRMTPHCCRHGFATGLLRRGVDVVTVAWLGGWRTAAQVLKTYGHANKNPKLTDLLIGTQLTQSEPQNEENAQLTGTSST